MPCRGAEDRKCAGTNSGKFDTRNLEAESISSRVFFSSNTAFFPPPPFLFPPVLPSFPPVQLSFLPCFPFLLYCFLFFRVFLSSCTAFFSSLLYITPILLSFPPSFPFLLYCFFPLLYSFLFFPPFLSSRFPAACLAGLADCWRRWRCVYNESDAGPVQSLREAGQKQRERLRLFGRQRVL